MSTGADVPVDYSLIRPSWSAPAEVVAVVTTRPGGVSLPPFDSFNLALHVGDDSEHVQRNRQLLAASLPDPVPVQWLTQVHGSDVHTAAPGKGSKILSSAAVPEADAIYLPEPGVAGAVLTADCLPVFLADCTGSAVAVVHAGWRGLVGGVLENTAGKFRDPATIAAWLGPAIGPCHFEVGPEVRKVFLERALPHDLVATAQAFAPAPAAGKWMADIYALARVRLYSSGIVQVSGGHFCTICESRFYSYRRDGRTGRMASLIYRRQA